MDHLGGTIVLQAIPAQKLLIEAVKSYASLQHVKSRGIIFQEIDVQAKSPTFASKTTYYYGKSKAGDHLH